MRSVVLGVFLCAVLSLVHPQCFSSPHTAGVKFCQDTTDKTWHPVGTTWRNSKCMDCDCTAESMNCCSAMANPTNYPDKCTVERDYTTCTVQVVEKIQCPHAATGK
nr:beta-microseminoprotein-like [Misgurnus anguillicaudatus]